MKKICYLLDNNYKKNFQRVNNKRPREEKILMSTTTKFQFKFVMFVLTMSVMFFMTLYGARAQTQAEDTSPISPVTVQDAPSDVSMENPPSEENAETYFRRGVGLYKKELYREALTEFNRALALDPNHKEAQVYQQKFNSQLQLSIG